MKLLTLFFDFRELKKLMSTYVDALPEIIDAKTKKFTLHLIHLLPQQVD